MPSKLSYSTASASASPRYCWVAAAGVPVDSPVSIVDTTAEPGAITSEVVSPVLEKSLGSPSGSIESTTTT